MRNDPPDKLGALNPAGLEIVRLLSTYLGGGYGKKNDLRAGLSFAHNVRCF